MFIVCLFVKNDFKLNIAGIFVLGMGSTCDGNDIKDFSAW